ncbi:MAG: phosphonoacetaldehyde hydrolase [Candidatus Competibacteraceae bacterium]|nr:phosphonoacetaldehyde hydrolase [Candidatus Competibacteraceae bacterium]MCB1807628.1 phosphonoacetaldehyde hydrolase [Candidatus Competibacteraceae bacterium]MCB1811178.1 phosphonoacetaldehyde hydrolase [Candidatus Competibacteraceae bacterium]
MSHIYDFRTTRSYQGSVQAVILDWAGTILDFGCVAPAVVFVEVFKRHQVALSLDESRGPMGAEKKDHIRMLTELAAVRQRWIDAHGRAPNEQDVETMYAEFIPLQLDVLAQYSELIPGALDTLQELRAQDIKIGTTTGYNREMTEINLREAARQGFEPDSTVSASEVPAGRPYPFMCLQNAIQLKLETVAACVKVDDTVPGIHAGLNAGMWTIGLTVSGNEVGLTLAEWNALSPTEQEARRRRAFEKMSASGAHYVVDSIADVMPCIEDINARLACGEKP